MDERGPSRAGDLVATLFDGALAGKLNEASRFAKAWYSVNGDRERAHTVGVWMNKGKRPGEDPILVVGLDSSLFALELGTNKDLYLARLAWAGFHVSDIRFTVTARKETRPTLRRGRDKAPAKELPALTETEAEAVRRATKDLPEGLRQSVSRAMSASLRRNKAK